MDDNILRLQAKVQKLSGELIGLQLIIEKQGEQIDQLLYQLNQRDNAWRSMILDFCKDCETIPMAVIGEMTPDVGRIFLYQAKQEWLAE